MNVYRHVLFHVILSYLKNTELKNGVSASNFDLRWGKKILQNSRNAERNFWRGDNGKNSRFRWFSKVKSCSAYAEDSKCSGRPTANKTDENVGQVKEPFLKNRRISNHEVANSLELHTGQFRAFLKKICTSIRSLPDLCPASFIWARITGNKQNDCHSTLPLHQSSIIYFFPKTQDSIEAKEI
jgi:hypothetical protein